MRKYNIYEVYFDGKVIAESSYSTLQDVVKQFSFTYDVNLLQFSYWTSLGESVGKVYAVDLFPREFVARCHKRFTEYNLF